MNKERTEVKSRMLRNKLGTLATRLQQAADPKGANPDYQTLEKIIAQSVKILSDFYKRLSEPIHKPNEIKADTLPDPDDYNDNFQAIADDLEVVFAEFENLESLVLGNFNYIVSRLNRLNRKLKSTYSSLGDFILYADLPLKDAFYFQDSFTNLARVETNSPLLNGEQCEINQVEGIATLPVDRESQEVISVTELPVINSNSNGVNGNNQEAGAATNSDISTITDNNADTWFEYERVVAVDDGVTLVLDFTINLGDIKVINFVRINPNNFGTKTQVKIVNIDTSSNGNDFISIKDDIPIADFVVEDEENVFTLAPSTSKYAGQGLYTFTAREAKYIRFTLEQQTPYTIVTSAGLTKSRYAIGIRDVEVAALPYKTKAELISTEYLAYDDIRKVALLSNQNPDAATTSALVSIDHYVSPDNGITWHQIRPLVSGGLIAVDQTVPEVLDFNGVGENSIETTNPVYTLRYKAVMERYTEAFVDDASELAQRIQDGTELHSVPGSTPFELTLQQRPITGTIKLIDPNMGSRGKDDIRYKIAKGTGSQLRIVLSAFKPLVKDKSKVLSGGKYYIQESDPQTIYINGIAWSRGALSGASTKNYKLNFEEGTLEFGDGTNGKAVPNDSLIEMSLSEERVFPGRGEGHYATLQYPTARDQKRVALRVRHPEKTVTKVLNKGATRNLLDADIVSGSALRFSSSAAATSFVTEIDFDNWDEDSQSDGDWSVDRTNGVLYNKLRTSEQEDMTVTYTYYPSTVLTENQWSFAEGTEGSNVISISADAFQTFTASTMDVPKNAKYFNLAHMAIVKGTIEFKNSITGNVPATLSQEVEFVDGRTELLGAISTTEELSPITSVGFHSIPFRMKVIDNTSYAVTFSNTTIFSQEVVGEPSSPGEYRVRRDYGLKGSVEVYVGQTYEDPGEINYYYRDYQINRAGRYSVNYETGEVYCVERPGINVTVDYEYTDYRVKYDIARLVNADDWDHDNDTNKITIKDREIMKNLAVRQTGAEGAAKRYYQVSYQYIEEPRDNVTNLEPYFTPVLKDYALKVVTKSRLI